MILMCAGLDSESVWSELELRNMPLEKHTRKTLARLLQSEDMSVSGLLFLPRPAFVCLGYCDMEVVLFATHDTTSS